MSAKGKTKAAVLENVIENGKNVKKIFKKIVKNLLTFSFYYAIIKHI